MDFHDFKTRLERTEKRIQCAAFSEKNKKIISDYKKAVVYKGTLNCKDRETFIGAQVNNGKAK